MPNCDLARPSQRSPIPNFYLAGAPLAAPRPWALLRPTLDLNPGTLSTHSTPPLGFDQIAAHLVTAWVCLVHLGYLL